MNGVTYPACFASNDDFEQWRRMARIARETTTPCNDCNQWYRRKMQADGRCDQDLVVRRFVVRCMEKAA